jgi:hypothetical protein
MYKVYKMIVKEKLAGEPDIYIVGGHKVKLAHNGKYVRADELVAGDQIEMGVPFMPSIDFDIKMTFIELKETEHTNKRDRGIKWQKK